MDAPYDLFLELVHFCYKPKFLNSDRQFLLGLKELNNRFKVIQMTEMIDEQVNQSDSKNQLRKSFMDTSAAIQLEMAPGT